MKAGASFFIRLRERIIRAWLRWLNDRLVWITDERRTFNGAPSDRWALVAVLGREHLSEQREIFRSSQVREIMRALRLRSGFNSPRTLFSVASGADGGTVVTSHIVDLSFELARLKAVFWIPETILLAKTLAAEKVAEVDRPGVSYYLDPSGLSRMAGGVIQNVDVFAWAVGAPTESAVERIEQVDVVPRLRLALLRAVSVEWWYWRSRDLGALVRQHARPLAVTTAVVVTAYLLLVSVYLKSAVFWHERQLERLGPEVGVLLDRQREAERVAAEARILSGIFQPGVYSYRLWAPVREIWDTGASLNGIEFDNERLTFRGRSFKSTELLGRLSARADVTEAKFAAPVRQVETFEEFAISFRLKPAASP